MKKNKQNNNLQHYKNQLAIFQIKFDQKNHLKVRTITLVKKKKKSAPKKIPFKIYQLQSHKDKRSYKMNIK